ncbi:MAG: type VI secretion protein ImpB [Hyphomicrobiales bacterium]|nr:type VI secretion protein ImpB [Hyphomicrobiales bacterium]
MRRVDVLESLYLDFDGFFASVMQQAIPALRGKPVGIIPFETNRPDSTSVIACSKEAKRYGVQNVMRVPDARALCPNLILVPQRPDYFRRAHNTLLNEIACEIPIETVKSIDELCCRLDTAAANDPQGLSDRLKARLAANVGPFITCSIGFAANRQLAKIACKIDKPNGTTIWHPADMPGPLRALPLTDIPGIGRRMEVRLNRAGIWDVSDLLDTQPKQLRQLWGSVTGERMWHALHGYHITSSPTRRGMFGHGRVLPPDARTPNKARECARFLLTKAARRMRREHFYARGLYLSLKIQRGGTWGATRRLPIVNDDHACLEALAVLWRKVERELPRSVSFKQVGTTLFDLVPATARQLDLFNDDDARRQKWEAITHAIDTLNMKHGKRVVTIGPWNPPGTFTGGKIAFTRIPSAEDFL